MRPPSFPVWDGHSPDDLLGTDQKLCPAGIHHNMIWLDGRQPPPDAASYRFHGDIPANHGMQGTIDVRIKYAYHIG